MAASPIHLHDSPFPLPSYNLKPPSLERVDPPYVSEQPAPNLPPSYSSPNSQQQNNDRGLDPDLERSDPERERADVSATEPRETDNGAKDLFVCCSEDKCCTCRSPECVPGIWTKTLVTVVVLTGCIWVLKRF